MKKIEILHTLGLNHTFPDMDNQTGHLFEKHSTDNIMDYMERGSNKRLPATYKWQWDIVKDYAENRLVDFGDDADVFGAFDDPKDQQAIKIGFRLYDKFKNKISELQTQDILNELYKAHKKNKPLQIELCGEH